MNQFAEESNADLGSSAARLAADVVARRSYGKLVALLAARTGDVAAAEDALSDAFVAALTDWPAKGSPDNPEAWLLTAARRKLIDIARRQKRSESSIEDLRIIPAIERESNAAEIPDHRLALMFACAHPAIDMAIRSPLILQTVLGLNAAQIASAFLLSPGTMGQRLTRAKEKIKQAGIPFRVPQRDELDGRLEAVLDAVYAAFTEGWSDPGGTDASRRGFAEEAIYLGQVIVELLPNEPEGMGLLALMLHLEARRSARRDTGGEFIPLADQEPSKWNWRMIESAEQLILRASAAGVVGRFQLEAAIQSAHVFRLWTESSNWPDVLRLYDLLLSLTRSPVVAINRALALAEVEGPTIALSAIDQIATDPRIRDYQPYWAARAHLLTQTGALPEAHAAYQLAIGLEPDPSIRRFLQHKQQRLRD